MSSDESQTKLYRRPPLTFDSTAPMDPALPQQDLAMARTMEQGHTPHAPHALAFDQTVDAAAHHQPSPHEPIERLHNGLILHDQFQVRSKLGEGGMGEVWRAYDASLDREVAIKVLSGEQVPELKARFVREARAQARLNHPNIVPLYFIGDQGGLLFFVMELVPGSSLATFVERQEPLPSSRAIELMIELSRALKHAHQRGIIHRDIKPGNIILDEEGHPKLADFGLAKPIDATAAQGALPELTAQHSFVGTPWYMAPEQGRSEKVDHRADMYALGATFYHLLTMRPLYDGNSSIAVILKHSSEAIPDPRKLNPELSERFAKLLMRLVAKSPQDRFAHYDELIEALEQARPRAMRPAGLTPRLMAGSIDFVLAAILAGITLKLVGEGMEGMSRMAFAAYFIATMGVNRTTPGLWLLNLQVKDARQEPPKRKRALLRLVAQVWSIWPIFFFGVIISALYPTQSFQLEQGSQQLPLGVLAYVILIAILLTLQVLSIWMIAIHPKRRALHDLLTRTYVTYRD